MRNSFLFVDRLKSVAILLLLQVWLALGAACGDSPNAPLTRAERFQAALENARASNNVIGVSAAVIVPGEGTWVGVSGRSDPTTALRPEMLFGIASVTKTSVAALILKLAEAGLVTLDDSLHNWLPAFQNIDTTITIRQLLNHTSGVFDYVNDSPDFWPAVKADLTKAWTPEEGLAFVQAPYFPPGSGWAYSNANYILLGMIIEEATGSPVATELRNRLWNPLNLNSTFLAVEEAIAGDVAHPWSDFFDGDGTLDDIASLPRTALYSTAWTAGAMFSTAGELATWTKALYEGQVISQSSLGQMLTFYPVPPTWSPPLTGYGLGTGQAIWSGRELWGHLGNIPGYRSLVVYSPDDGLTMAILINQDVGNDLRLVIAAALLNVALDTET